MRNLRIILFIGTAMLIAGIFLIQSFYHWALAFILQDAEIIKNAEGFFTRILATEGAYFTLILAVVYLPAAFILQARVDSTTELLTDAKEKEEALKKYNLSFSLTESLPRLLAILGPFLAGPVGELFSRLFK